ncbi:MAG: hypothetical protein QNL91_00920 [Candidatus Krumholzibacteria bacterium]|nr:hypothetical protein [Candidatus Krumholzibacteria bacterium]
MRTFLAKILPVLGLVLFLTFFAGCGDDPTGLEGGAKILSGNVLMGVSGLPTAGAWVFLSEPISQCEGSPPLYPVHSDSVQTDQTGNFQFTIKRDVVFDIFAGLDSTGVSIRFSHISHPTTIDMTYGNSVAGVGLEVHGVVAGTNLSVAVNDLTTEDIAPGAAVTLWRREGIGYVIIAEAVADTLGEIQIDDLSSGIYRMSASAVSVLDAALVTDYWGPQFLHGGADWGPMILKLDLPVDCDE